MGIGRMMEPAAKLPFPIHGSGIRPDTRRLQHFLGHASITEHGPLNES
jgi:hypothetical protein